MLKDIIKGITAYFGSFKLITKLKLWNYFAIPILISFIVGGIIVSLGYAFSDNIGTLLSKLWIWDWGKETFGIIGTVIGWIAILALGLILYRHIVMALVSPFMSPVSEKIEKYFHEQKGNGLLIKHKESSFGVLLTRGLRISLRNIFKETSFTILLLICSLIPVINILITPLIFLVASYYAGFGNMDYTLERHFNYKESISFVRKYRGIAIGNGIVFMLLLFIPVVGFIIVLPLSVTASSLKTLEKIYANK